MALGQVEEESNEGFSHGWGGDKCSGGRGQARKNGESRAPRTGLGRGWGDAAKGFVEQRISKGGFTAKGDLVQTFLDLEEHISPQASPPSLPVSSWTVFGLFMAQKSFPLSGGFLSTALSENNNSNVS